MLRGARRRRVVDPRMARGPRSWLLPAPVVVALVAMAVAASGCQYLFGFPAGPDFSLPVPSATYGQGRATITIAGGGPDIVLDELSRPGTYEPSLGGDVAFRNADGWHLQVLGGSAGGALGAFGSGYVQLDRIADGRHWTIFDPTRCILTIATADETAMRGSATCKGLRWSDAIGGGFTATGPAYIPDEPAFDAEITFEATPTDARTN